MAENGFISSTLRKAALASPARAGAGTPGGGRSYGVARKPRPEINLAPYHGVLAPRAR